MHALAKATLAAVDERSAGRGRTTDRTCLHAEEPGPACAVHEITKSSYEFGAEWLRAFDARELPMPPEHLVRVIHALIEGLVMQRIVTPELCPDEVFYAAFAALARPASR